MEIFKIDNSKFKSIYISYNYTMEVKDTKIFSENSVLACLMAKSSKKYNSQKEIEMYLGSLYGTNFDVNVEKCGDLYNIEFRIEYINRKFLPNKEELLDKVLDFLNEIIYVPADWTDENIKREKDFILERISQRKDEKLKYGIQRAEELLCEGEPFGTYLYGEEEVVKNIKKEDLLSSYKEFLNSSLTIIVSGNLEGYDNIEEKIKDKFSNIKVSDVPISKLNYNVATRKFEDGVQEIVEYQDTTQAVLSMGFSVEDITPNDFYIANVYNAILGTTPSSKLFQNVREKESLAYTVRSRYYRFKDMIVIFAGINKDDSKKAVLLINEQLKQIINGDVSEIEFNSAKDSLVADLLEMNDTKIGMCKMKLANLIAFKNGNIQIDDMIEKINAVTLDDVIEFAKKVTLRKVFVLGGVSKDE